jgi:hypothetical protein
MQEAAGTGRMRGGKCVVLWRIVAMAACAALLAACATITKGTTQLVAVDTPGLAGAVCTINHGERTTNGNDARHRHAVQRLRVASDPMRQAMLRHRHERNPVKRRGHGRRQRYFRRRDRAWRRCSQRRPEQISRSGHGGDVARSCLPEAAAGFAAGAAANVESLTCRCDSMRALSRRSDRNREGCVYVVVRACAPKGRT